MSTEPKPKIFPKELLRIIKSYEYSLLFYSNKRKQVLIDSVSQEVYQPYYLRGTSYHKSDEGQIDHILNYFNPTDFQYITKQELIRLIITENHKAKAYEW